MLCCSLLNGNAATKQLQMQWAKVLCPKAAALDRNIFCFHALCCSSRIQKKPETKLAETFPLHL